MCLESSGLADNRIGADGFPIGMLLCCLGRWPGQSISPPHAVFAISNCCLNADSLSAKETEGFRVKYSLCYSCSAAV